MPASKNITINFLQELSLAPLPLLEFQKNGVAIENFIATLSAEGCIFRRDNDFLHWVNKEGFGELTLSARCQQPVFFTETCASTNTWAREMVEKESITEGIFVCSDQSSGRGRMGRTWIGDNPHSLTVSFVVSPKVKVGEVAVCSLVWMADIAKALGLFVKWPNDIMTSAGKKIGGSLTELVDNTPTIIFGLGMNVSHETPPLETASSLRLEGNITNRMELLGLVSDIVYTPQSFELDVWRERALYTGKRIRVQNIEGMMTGIRADGALLIDNQPILVGDVELVENK